MTRNIISIVALLTLLTASVVLIGRQGVTWLPEKKGIQHVTLEVPDSNGLVPRSKVLLRGVPIGEVKTVIPDAQRVAVQFEYPKDVQVPVDSQFRIESLSALGEAYLAITPINEGGALLADKQRLVSAPVTAAGNMGETAVALTRFMGALNPDLVHGIVNELNTGMSDDSAAPVLAKGTRNFRTLVRARHDDLYDILSEMQTLIGHSDVIAPNLKLIRNTGKNLFDNAKGAVEGAIELFYVSGNYPGDMRYGIGELLRKVVSWVAEIGPDLYNLTQPLMAPMQATAAALTTWDTSRLLDGAIDALEVPGAFTVHVVPSR